MALGETVRCVVLGGGGHARVLVDGIRFQQNVELYAVLDSDRTLWGKMLLEVPILGGDEMLPEVKRQGVTHFVLGLGGSGDNQPRRRLFEWAIAQGLAPLTIVHPAAICSRWAWLGEGCVLYPAAVVNAGAVVGRNVIVNSGAIVEHDCVVGDHVHVATGAVLASTVNVGALAHIGAGATVRQCVSIGEGAVVGAGAAVVKDVPPHMVVAGVPARPIRKTVQKSQPYFPSIRRKRQEG